MSFITELQAQLVKHRNAANAEPMSNYMKNKFPFLGIKATARKSILRDVINQNKSEVKTQVTDLTKTLYSFKEREYHYCAIELYARFKRKTYQPSDQECIRYLLTTHSHWDTVDFIAKHILGQFLWEHPNQRFTVSKQFSEDPNFWLNRSAILFQLGYKTETDAKLLFQLCATHTASDEFFIKKAIGWALREYAKVNPEAVLSFVKTHTLKPLSKFEALRRIT